MRAASWLNLAAGIALIACSRTSNETSATPPQKPASVNGARLAAADAEPAQWMSHGCSYDEQRFSPLEEATPIVVDGVRRNSLRL